MKYWLMKSEPEELSIDSLMKKVTWHWDGVRNYEARNMMRDQMKIGDLIIFYHSNANPSGPAGIASVASAAYMDHTQFDQLSRYYDSKATPERPIWWMVDVKFVKKFDTVISRNELREHPMLQGMILWKRNRLSITPLTKSEFDTICSLR